MIYYQPNKNWLLDLRYLLRSRVIVKTFQGVLMIGLFSAAVTVLAIEVFDLHTNLPSGVFSLLGIILSIMLVFRTNTSYDRWWEGRKQWGALVNNSRNLSAQLHAALPHQEQPGRFFFAKHIANFVYAMKEHLREGVRTEELIYLSDAEKKAYGERRHIPNYIVYRIQHRLQQFHRNGQISDADYITLQPLVHSLLDTLGACERIKKTPIPFSYTVYVKSFILLYSVALPLGLITDFGYYTIPLSMFVSFAMLGVELIGEEIEDPFGTDNNDLMTGQISDNIRNNVFELFGFRDQVLPLAELQPYEDVD